MRDAVDEYMYYVSPDELKAVVRDVLITNMRDVSLMQSFFGSVRLALVGAGINLVSLLAVNGTVVRGSVIDVTPTEFAHVVRYLRINDMWSGLKEILNTLQTYYPEDLAVSIKDFEKNSSKKKRSFMGAALQK